MKTTKTALMLMFVVGLSVSTKAYETRRPKSSSPTTFEVLSYNRGTGALTIRFSIKKVPEGLPPIDCDNVRLTFYARRGMQYNGDTMWTAPFTSDGYSHDFHVTIPENDTSCLVVLLEFCGKAKWADYRGWCFAPIGDSLATFEADGRYYGDLWDERSQRRIFKEWEKADSAWWRQTQEKLERQRNLPPSEGKVWRGIPIAPEDSAWAATLSDTDKRKLAKMRWRERKPLTEYDSESFLIGGESYIRFRGQKKFHHQEKRTREQMRADYKRFLDSLAAHPSNKIYEYDVVLDLRKTEDYDFVETLVDSLIPTDSAGFYRAIMKRPPLVQIEKRGIRIIATHNWPPRRERQKLPTAE